VCYKTFSLCGFSMRRLPHILVILAASLALPIFAADPAPQQEQTLWDFDTIAAPPAVETTNHLAGQEIWVAISGMRDRWNAHDLEGYVAYFWNSPALVSVVDGDVTFGWQDLHDKYLRGFHDPNDMGNLVVTRVQVRMTDPNTAFVLTYWTVSFGKTKHVVVGVDSSSMRRIDGAWKIAWAHTTSIEM
jgi:ketosteroid isomerase-like protein